MEDQEVEHLVLDQVEQGNDGGYSPPEGNTGGLSNVYNGAGGGGSGAIGGSVNSWPGLGGTGGAGTNTAPILEQHHNLIIQLKVLDQLMLTSLEAEEVEEHPIHLLVELVVAELDYQHPLHHLLETEIQIQDLVVVEIMD
jgi:hypothetical protein